MCGDGVNRMNDDENEVSTTELQRDVQKAQA